LRCYYPISWLCPFIRRPTWARYFWWNWLIFCSSSIMVFSNVILLSFCLYFYHLLIDFIHLLALSRWKWEFTLELHWFCFVLINLLINIFSKYGVYILINDALYVDVNVFINVDMFLSGGDRVVKFLKSLNQRLLLSLLELTYLWL